MNNNVWVYWQNRRKRSVEPAYITLCRWTMLHNWQDSNIHFVNEESAEMYLPGITKLVSPVEVDIKGRLDRAKRKFISYDRNLAVRSDVIRAHLINKFGGIYVDSGVIAFNSLQRYFDIVNSGKFLVSQRSSHGKSHYPVNFYGALPNHPVIAHYITEQRQALSTKTEFHYNELGASMLSPAAKLLSAQIHILGEKEIQPITFESAGKQYSDPNLQADDFLTKNSHLFKLFSRPFKEEFANYSVEDFYYSDSLLGKLFRRALPEKAFYEYSTLHNCSVVP